jgi:hypothetical protein
MPSLSPLRSPGLSEKAPDIHRLERETYEAAINHSAHRNPKGIFGHVQIDDARPDGLTAVTHGSPCDADCHETTRGVCVWLDYTFLIVSIITLSRATVTSELTSELHALNDVKERAISAYQCSSVATTPEYRRS